MNAGGAEGYSRPPTFLTGGLAPPPPPAPPVPTPMVGDTMMALLMTIYTDKLETGENVCDCERAEFFYICVENIQFFSIFCWQIIVCR